MVPLVAMIQIRGLKPNALDTPSVGDSTAGGAAVHVELLEIEEAAPAGERSLFRNKDVAATLAIRDA